MCALRTRAARCAPDHAHIHSAHPSRKIGRQNRTRRPKQKGPASRGRSESIRSALDDELRPRGRQTVSKWSSATCRVVTCKKGVLFTPVAGRLSRLGFCLSLDTLVSLNLRKISESINSYFFPRPISCSTGLHLSDRFETARETQRQHAVPW